jgi:phospholipase C
MMLSAARLSILALAAALATTACSQVASSSGAVPLGQGASQASGSGSSSQYIKHVIVMIQENRSFDNFFATYPGADGATGGCEKPLNKIWHFRHHTSNCPSGDTWVPLTKASLEQLNLGHQHFSFDNEYDKGNMDGFNKQTITVGRGQKEQAGNYAYRYTDPNDIPEYWDIANQYVLGDHMFTTQSSDSFTGHQDLIAGDTHVTYKGATDNVIDFPVPAAWGCDAKAGTKTSLITTTGKYLKAKGPYPCFTYSTLRDLLDAQGVSWLYFTNTMNGYVWNAFEAITAVRNGPEWATNIVQPQTKIFSAISNGTLPAVSWVIPDSLDSDHPSTHSDSGPSWIASVVNAVGQSNYWDNTVVIVVWDDWGGQFDHVAPPQLDGQGLGMRVPMLLVSAYARETSSSQPGYISHTQYEFGSILKFIETTFNLGSLGNTDARANNLLDCFNFTQQPRTFVAIPSKYSKEYFLKRPPSNLPVDEY